MKKAMFLLMALLSMTTKAQDLKDQLLNYQYERVQLTNATQSKLIDLIKVNNFDSVNILINFCDSINSPNFNWLSKSERFIIKMIEPDINYLLDFNNYVKDLGFSDTFTNINYFYPNSFNSYNTGNYDEIFRDCKTTFSSANPAADLNAFLLLYGKNKLKEYLKSDSKNQYLWEFIQIFYPNDESNNRNRYYYNRDYAERKKINTEIEIYLIKYPETPFGKLILMNLYRKYEYSKNGCIFGIAYEYNAFDNAINKFVNDGSFFNAFIDIYVKGVPLKTNMSIRTCEFNSDYIYNNDTLPKQVSIINVEWDFSTGYLFHLANRWHLTPFAGLNITSYGISDTSDQNQYSGIKLPTLLGASCGYSLDYNLTQANDQSVYGPYVNWGLRIETGYRYTPHNKLETRLGNSQLYATIGLSVIGMGIKRINHVNSDAF